MITKQRLLAGINEMRYVEESMVTFLANFSKAVVDETEELGEEKKKKLKKLLLKLYNDSSRHETTIVKMAETIEKSLKNEY
ncbi:MAG: hypothetical protein ISS33_05345 [Candidatus Omnitrophica bacterium]|nr:hypothetical protein [Candidatus Omnitrophota bacterium]